MQGFQKNFVVQVLNLPAGVLSYTEGAISHPGKEEISMKKNCSHISDVQQILTLLDHITEAAERIVNHMEKELKIRDKGTVIGTGSVFA